MSRCKATINLNILFLALRLNTQKMKTNVQQKAEVTEKHTENFID